MKIDAAQINCTVGEIKQNLDLHYQLIELAIERGVDLILFPEMSITGYCREEGRKLCLTADDQRLMKLREYAADGGIYIIAGAPVLLENELYIGSFIFSPDRTVNVYTKQYLHDGEELYYASSMNYNPVIRIGNEKIALAICADINCVDHPNAAKQRGSTVYLPGIFYAISGIEAGYELLQQYATQFSLNILMANYSGELWNVTAGGRSAFWGSNGELIGNLEVEECGLMLVEKVKMSSLYYQQVLFQENSYFFLCLCQNLCFGNLTSLGPLC